MFCQGRPRRTGQISDGFQTDFMLLPYGVRWGSGERAKAFLNNAKALNYLQNTSYHRCLTVASLVYLPYNGCVITVLLCFVICISFQIGGNGNEKDVGKPAGRTVCMPLRLPVIRI